MTEILHTDVLVVGSGPAGGAAALSLATLGVEHVVVTKYSWTANTPRAHITNQRTIEIFRDLGIEDDIRDNGTPNHLMGDTVFCTSLSGDEIGRVRTWGTHPARHADYTLASPSEHCDLPQTLLEPILIGHAAARTFASTPSTWGSSSTPTASPSASGTVWRARRTRSRPST
jgi:2,4-dichlorophenol 6-monooxygenase